MVGLLAYVAGTSINNAVNLDRAPNLIHATSLPTAEFTRLVQDERAAAVVYLFQPTAANLAAYDAERHTAVLPMFEFTSGLADLETPPPPEVMELIAAVARRPDQVPRFLGLIAGSVTAPELFSAESVAEILRPTAVAA